MGNPCSNDVYEVAGVNIRKANTLISWKDWKNSICFTSFLAKSLGEFLISLWKPPAKIVSVFYLQKNSNCQK